jgi:PTH1 family peptidyl-tRNA hydrolase
MIKTNLDKFFEILRTLPKHKDPPTESKDELSGNNSLIVGLGNPGREYRDTRHNIGFRLVNEIAHRLEVDFTRTQSKALVTIGRYKGNKIILAKPQTFMNRSGFATRELVKFYKINLVNLLILYDDVDLPFGKIRMKPSGGSAGHKGINSIAEQLGTNEFPRLRFGVGRPSGSKKAKSYVLKHFSKDENEFLENYVNRAVDAALSFTVDGIDYVMTLYNRSDK